MFNIGDMVICIKDTPWCPGGGFPNDPKMGCLYMIIQIKPGQNSGVKLIGLQFQEIQTNLIGYDSRFFIKVIDYKETMVKKEIIEDKILLRNELFGEAGE